MSSGIGLLNEKALHADLKLRYARRGDRFEVERDGYRIDIVRDRLLIEIQTAGLGALRKKLTTLLKKKHPVRLVHPIAAAKWIVTRDAQGNILRRRKSPKQGRFEDIFSELVGIPTLLADRRFSLDILLVREEEVREQREVRRRRWEKPWIRLERRLLDIVDHRLIASPQDLAAFLPAVLPRRFTTRDIAAAARIPRWLAQKMAYCLRLLHLIRLVGKEGNSMIYASRAMPSKRRSASRREE